MACERLEASDRIDLAIHLALCVVRGAWASRSDNASRTVAADAGGALFETYARRLWERCEAGALDDDGLLAYGAGLVAYRVRAIRVAELLGLFALRLRVDEPETS